MPGLLRGIARTAIIAGTATAVSNRISRAQAGRWAEQDQQGYEQEQYEQQEYERAQGYEQPPRATSSDAMNNKIAQLKELGELKEQGVLTEAEFEAQKQQILG
jgi:hypothetical protein